MTQHDRFGDGDPDRVDELVARAAREHYNPAPESPRDEMWAVIQAARAEHASRADSSIVPISRFRPRQWWIGIAAALVIGVAIGRSTLFESGPRAPQVTDPGSAAIAEHSGPAAEESADARRALPYRLAAADHLTRSEAFLTMFRADSRQEQLDEEIGTWARSLLTRTRLLLDSPAARDPQMSRLLEDLELVLVQIVQLRGEDPEGLQFVDEGMDRRQLMFRLRAASAAAPVTAGI
jgi:hypothetical protein